MGAPASAGPLLDGHARAWRTVCRARGSRLLAIVAEAPLPRCASPSACPEASAAVSTRLGRSCGPSRPRRLRDFFASTSCARSLPRRAPARPRRVRTRNMEGADLQVDAPVAAAVDISGVSDRETERLSRSDNAAGPHDAAAASPSRHGAPSEHHDPRPSLARRMLSQDGLEGNPLELLEVTERFWSALRHQKRPAKGPTVVKEDSGPMPPRPGVGVGVEGTGQGAGGGGGSKHDYDAVVCGGTLGVVLGLALQLRGLSVCIVEKRLLRGRTQVRWEMNGVVLVVV